MKTAVVVGQNYPDETLGEIVQSFDRVIVFEPLPDAAAACRKACSLCSHVLVIQAACGTTMEVRDLHVYNERGLSSSFGVMTEDAVALYDKHDLRLKTTMAVQVVHLGYMLDLFGIRHVGLLMIDAQGMDFTILKTVEQWIAEQRIESIQLEADGNGFRHYAGLPDNSEEAIIKWMSRFPRYKAGRLPGMLVEQPDLIFELTQ